MITKAGSAAMFLIVVSTLGGVFVDSDADAQSLTPAGQQFVNVLINIGQIPAFQRFLAGTLVMASRLESGVGPATISQVINKINALGQLPFADQSELVLEYYLIADIIFEETFDPNLVQAWIDGVWGISVGPVSSIFLPFVVPSEIAWRDDVIALIRAKANQGPAPPGTGLFETDPVLVCQTENWIAVLGNPNATQKPCF